MEMEYEYLIHSAKGTSWSKKNAKYIFKKKVNGKWVYYYNNPEARNYQQVDVTNMKTGEQSYMSQSPKNDQYGPYANLDDVIKSLSEKKSKNIERMSANSGVKSKHTLSDNNKKIDQAISEAENMKEKQINQPAMLRKLIRHNDQDYGYLIHSAKGSTWKKNTKYVNRYQKNGKWYYEYAITDAMKKSSNFDKRRAEKFNEMDSKKRAANLGEIDKYAQKSWNDTLKEREDLARTNNRVSGNYYKKQQSINLQKKKKNAEDRREAHEQYLKDTQEGRNRERQAKILKGKTGGVVNAKHKKGLDSWEKNREQKARVDHRGTNYGGGDGIMKNNAKNKRSNVSINSNNKQYLDYLNWPADSIPRNMNSNAWWESANQRHRIDSSKERSAKTKKLNSKSYRIRNKASGKVKTIKKKIKGE